MQILSGTITELSKEDPNNKGFKKKILSIESNDNQTAFIEFRGDILKRLEAFRKGDSVIIAIQMKASTSRNSGIQFNNLIAKSIKSAA